MFFLYLSFSLFLQLQKFIGSQKVEEEKLKRIVVEADTERARQKKEMEGVLTERDLLASQLLRRNEELSLLHEKVRRGITKNEEKKDDKEEQERNEAVTAVHNTSHF